MKKKQIAGLLALLFLVVLVGCSAADEAPEESTPVLVALDLDAPSTVTVFPPETIDLSFASRQIV